MMNKKEIEQLRQEILTKNIFMRQLRVWFLLSMLIFAACALVAIWGFSGIMDPYLPKVGVEVRQPIAWIAAVVGSISAFFSVLVVIALINGRKHVLSLIDRLTDK
jgi:hypothetical protein